MDFDEGDDNIDNDQVDDDSMIMMVLIMIMMVLNMILIMMMMMVLIIMMMMMMMITITKMMMIVMTMMNTHLIMVEYPADTAAWFLVRHGGVVDLLHHEVSGLGHPEAVQGSGPVLHGSALFHSEG